MKKKVEQPHCFRLRPIFFSVKFTAYLWNNILIFSINGTVGRVSPVHFSLYIYQGHRIVFAWFMTNRKQLVHCHRMRKAEKEVSLGKQSEGCTMTEGAVEQAVEQAEDKAN